MRQKEGGKSPVHTCTLKEEGQVTGRSVRRRKKERDREIEDTGKIGYFQGPEAPKKSGRNGEQGTGSGHKFDAGDSARCGKAEKVRVGRKLKHFLL